MCKFLRNSILFRTAAAPLYVPINSVQGPQFLHSLTNGLVLFLIVAILMGVGWYIIVLICISLIFSELVHLFICLLSHLYIIFRERSIRVLCAFLESGYSAVAELQECSIY